MRKLLAIGTLAVAAAFLPAVPAVAATPRTPAPASAHPAYQYWYIYEWGVDWDICWSDGAYLQATGQAYSFQCDEDSNGDEYYTLWLEAIV